MASSVKIGPNLNNCRFVLKSCLNSAKFGCLLPSLAEFGRNSARCFPDLAKFWRCWSTLGQPRPHFGQCGVISAEFGPTSVICSRIWPNCGGPGQFRATSDHISAYSGRFRPNSARWCAHLARMWSNAVDFGLPKLGQISTLRLSSAKNPCTCSDAPDVCAVWGARLGDLKGVCFIVGGSLRTGCNPALSAQISANLVSRCKTSSGSGFVARATRPASSLQYTLKSY